VQRLKTMVGNLLVPGNNEPWPEVRDTLNSVLLGWSNYFSYGTRRAPLRGVLDSSRQHVRNWQCAPKARITSGGGIHPENCRLIW
jgi:RNA-directed DNA polymerase